MPIYEYRCEQGHTFEVMQRMSDAPVGSCKTCEAPVQRVFHPVAVHFKGSGFYNTDYGTRKRSREKENETAKSDGDTKPDAKANGKSETKSDSKPAKKDSATATASGSSD